MSYDIYLKTDTGGEYPATVAEIGNMTSNCGGMWKLALGFPLYELDGKNAGESIPALERAVNDMQRTERSQEYAALEPSNGWGNLEGATRYLEKLLKGCREHPKSIIEVSR